MRVACDEAYGSEGEVLKRVIRGLLEFCEIEMIHFFSTLFIEQTAV